MTKGLCSIPSFPESQTHEDPETEAAESKSANINLIIYTFVKKVCCQKYCNTDTYIHILIHT